MGRLSEIMGFTDDEIALLELNLHHQPHEMYSHFYPKHDPKKKIDSAKLREKFNPIIDKMYLYAPRTPVDWLGMAAISGYDAEPRPPHELIKRILNPYIPKAHVPKIATTHRRIQLASFLPAMPDMHQIARAVGEKKTIAEDLKHLADLWEVPTQKGAVYTAARHRLAPIILGQNAAQAIRYIYPREFDSVEAYAYGESNEPIPQDTLEKLLLTSENGVPQLYALALGEKYTKNGNLKPEFRQPLYINRKNRVSAALARGAFLGLSDQQIATRHPEIFSLKPEVVIEKAGETFGVSSSGNALLGIAIRGVVAGAREIQPHRAL